MGIGKLLIVGVIVWIAFRLYKHLINRPSVTHKRTGSSSSKKMVQCKTCGLHVPIDEALSKNDNYYCCSAHRDQESS